MLETRGVSKRYGHVTALDSVDIAVVPGELVALVGDNGAGKSTLVGILCGLIQPDSGDVLIDGVPSYIESPHHAEALGISTVFQDLALVNQRDVAANLFLGREPVRLGFLLDRRRMTLEATDTIRRLKVELPDVRVLAGALSGGQRQAIAVARAIMRGTRMILMDEPTAALGVREARRVLDLVRELRDSGLSILLISHNIDNVFELADRIVVLRLGRNIGDLHAAAASRDEVVGLIVGGGVGSSA